MPRWIRPFLRDERGAVSMDFVALTALVIALGIVAVQPIATEAVRWATSVETADLRALAAP